jgi:peptide/nickel transport system substrate-binding protein/oligopeptide transport system substrate-binding protein
MKRFRRLVGLLSVMAMLVAALAISVPVAAQDTSKTLIVTSLSDVNSLDPALGYDTVSWPTESLVYRGLVTWDDEGKEIVPALAEKVDASSDGLTYTFTLRKGVKFSNGREITADDVKYTFERLLNPKTASPGTFIFDLIAGAKEFMDGTATEVSGIKVVDPATVEFTLARTEWTFLQRMATPFASIVAKEGVEAAGYQFGRQPLGAGPFVLKSWDSGVKLVFERNPNYYREGYPKVDTLELDIGVDPSVMVLRVESGEADTSLDFVAPADYPRISGDDALKDKLLLSPVPNVFYLGYNTREAPFDNAKVRQALSMAVDRDRIVQLLNGRPLAADGLFPPNLSGNNPDLPAMKFDPEGAKALLKEAGYADGLSTKIYATTDPADQTVVQAVAQDWESVGVKTEIVSLEFSQILDIMYGDNPGQMPVLYLSWYADYPDPSDFYQPLLQCKAANNTGGFCDEALDQQEAAAAAIPPGDDRWKAYGALEEAINKDMPWAPVFYGRNFFYSSARVKDLKPHPTYGLTFETASVS